MRLLSSLRRYLRIFHVFFEHGLFWVAYQELREGTVSDRSCTCSIDEEHRERAVRVCRALEELGPTFIKFGQLLASRPDLVPLPYVLELQRLRDSVEPVSFERMRPILEGECSCGIDCTCEGDCHCGDLDNIFDEFNREPIASASLAQVYRATLDGRTVAVKALRPGVLDTINRDIIYSLRHVLGRVLGFSSSYHLDGFIDEFRHMLQREVDLHREAMDMERFRRNFTGEEGVKVPRVYWEYSTDRVLVMEYIRGTKLSEYDGPRSEKKQLARDLARYFLKQIYIDGFIHADPHPSNLLVTSDGRIAYIDFGATAAIPEETREKLGRLYTAIYHRDPDMAVRVLFTLGEPLDDVDLDELRADMDTIITGYHLGPLAGETRQSDSFMRLARKYNIRVPRITTLFERALILTEGACLDLDPNFNVMSVSEELIEEMSVHWLRPSNLRREFEEILPLYHDIVRDFPYALYTIVEQFKSEGVPIRMSQQEWPNTLPHYGFLLMLLAASTYLTRVGETVLGAGGILLSITLALWLMTRG